MKVVIDTNIFVSSFFGGKPKRVIDLWKKGDVTLCLSGEILEEYVEVLHRLGLGDEKELEELLLLFAENVNISFTKKTPKLYIVEDDPDDNKFIECAVALHASYIITGDKALKAVESYMGIEILTPQQFLELEQKSHEEGKRDKSSGAR
jgi:putative PIN family toxin of toxin-antitoxin system